MGHDVRFIVLNGDEAYTGELRAALLAIKGAKIVAEVEEAALLAQAVKQFPVDAVVANLDPVPDAVLPILAEVASAESNLALFAVSASTDGPLILRAMRMGVREFLPKPIDSRALGEAVDKIAAHRADTVEMGTLIAVMGTSGGVGATMLATNLAVELAAIADGRVTIVDLDYRFGQVATLLDVEPTYTVADLCGSPEQLEAQVIERALVRHDSGLYVLSRPASFSQADTITAASCVGLLTNLLQFNDYVIADGPVRSDVSARSVLDISDINLLLVQLLVPTIRNAARILDGMRESGINVERTKLICNRIGRDATNLSVGDVAETLGLEPFATIPDDWSTVSGAINLGETLRNHSPKSRVRQAIEEIALRLHGRGSESDVKEGRRKSLIDRIFTTT